MPAASLRQAAAAILAVAVLAAAALRATPAPARARRAPEHRRDPHRRPVVRHAPRRPAGAAVAAIADPRTRTGIGCGSRTRSSRRRSAVRRARRSCPAAYSRHTHVRTNDDGARFDETQTIATWLHGAGYFTGLIGKYLNRYPFGRGPYIPPGWDRWVVKRNTAATTTYSNFGFVDQGVALQTSDAPATYATDLFADHAVDFLRTAPDDRPFFLYFATSAPHPPWTPPPRHAGAFADVALAGVAERGRAQRLGQARVGAEAPAGRRRRAGRLHRGPAARGGDPARRGRCGRADRRAARGERRAGAHGDPLPHRQRVLVRPAPDPGQALPVRGVHPDAVRGEGARSGRRTTCPD